MINYQRLAKIDEQLKELHYLLTKLPDITTIQVRAKTHSYYSMIGISFDGEITREILVSNIRQSINDEIAKLEAEKTGLLGKNWWQRLLGQW